MTDEPEKLVPQVPFRFDELQGIERVLWSYTVYLQQSGESSNNAQQVQTLKQIQERLSAQLVMNYVKDVQLFLTVAELEAVVQALLGFGDLLKRLFPPAQDRDAAIESVNLWRLRLVEELNIELSDAW